MSGDFSQDAADAITALGADPTPREVYEATIAYDSDYVVAAAASLAAGGSGGGGGGSILRQTLFGNGVTIANNASGDLTWDDGTSGPDQLLDLSVVAAPTVLASGVYAVTVTVQPTAPMTADGNFMATLLIDPDGADAEATGTGFSAKVSSTPIVPLTLVFYAPVATPLQVIVQNNDGTASRDFQIAQANVQRLS